MKALLIIDMQIGSFKPYTLRYDTLGVIERINKLSHYFRMNNYKVIFVQHDGTKENIFLPNTFDWELLPELVTSPADDIVSKSANDAFYNTNLHHTLAQSNITEIFVTGCATDFCIDATVKSAVSRDYEVTVVEDAHTTADRPHLTAPKVIEHYNWLWREMTPTNFKIQVIRTKDLLTLFA
ncbi:isochorismatase family protein [Pedobacter sp. MR2016-19]|uniref:isochorismatase family protein n=1 Tax=Pedobacter sp. MR2016-19 TaxID=2780089 RepID=UPI001873DF48|nr:isochorismatase family protein [Pedobacter sp. MR2016-19]MBE5321777.1 isochorismatase family protein [Pedobacter sp. MR2016-19]